MFIQVIAKDTNVILVGIASRCLTGLAIGLRKKFSPYALNVSVIIIGKKTITNDISMLACLGSYVGI